MKYFDHGVDNGVIRIDSNSQSTWEDAVCNIHNSASLLEDISGLVRETSGESVASTVESLGVMFSSLSPLRPSLFHVGPGCYPFPLDKEDPSVAN